jgi:hypothetical protein
MFSNKKRYVVIAGILIGFAIAYREQLSSGWQKLQRISYLNVDANPQETSLQPNDRLQTNSSLGEHFHTHNANFDAIREGKPSAMVSTNKNVSQSRNANTNPTVRIASFDMHAFGESKLKKSIVLETVAKMIRQFDVIALQHIQSRQQNILPELIDKVNQGDRRFDYCIGPRVGPEASQQQFAFVFDTDRIETDRQMLYTVDDPQQLMAYEPLVGWFRSRLVPVEHAFTFSLVNLLVDPLNSEREWKLLPDLIRSVRQDGRSEDDILLLGDFGCSDRELVSLKNIGMVFALEGTPTTVTGEAMLDNIVFPTRATDEFTGKSGVIDFLRNGNLSIDQAFQISTHMPVWGEFFASEGGSPGYIGTNQGHVSH